MDIPSPRWEVTLGNVLEEISGSIIFICGLKSASLLSGKILDALVSLEVVLHVVNLSLLINPFVGMR